METSPAKAIRTYCLDCCYESAMEVRLCPAEGCPLHPFRFGKNPFRKTSEAQKEAARRATVARIARQNNAECVESET